MNIAIFCIAVLCGGFIQSVSGFGFGIFVMLIFPYIRPVSECAAVSSLLSMSSSFVLAFVLRKKCRYKRLVFPFLGYIIGTTPAIFLSDSAPNEILKTMLAIMLMILSIYFLLFQSKIKLKESRLAGMTAGVLSGILGGFFAMGGPPIVAYLLQTSEDNDSYMAEVQTYFAITNLFSTAMRVCAGIVNESVLWHWIVGLVALAVGTLLGRIVFKHINSKKLKTIIYCFMLVSGIINLF